MSIHQITPGSQIAEYLKQEISKRETVVLNVLNRIGMECIREARNNGSYIDQTGNLRSSIGYAVLRNGAMYSKSDFASVKNGHDGSTTGNEFINELSKEYSGGLVLIVVAGMEYAAYVSTKRNVLASAEILALQLVPSLLSKLGFTK